MTTLKAIISDIHGNIEALEAVIADIKSQGIEDIYCLGDVVGYGPNPRECIDLVMETCQVCLLGNHDQGALFDPEGFNAGAERAIFWTRSVLESGDQQSNDRRWEFLCDLPRMFNDGDFKFVHGSARNPLNEYVFPEDIYNQLKMERIFGLIDRYCFQGHTHVPGIFTENLNFFTPAEVDHEFELTDQKVMVNVGSVGQPRDGDPRACYVVLENGQPTSSSSEDSDDQSEEETAQASGLTKLIYRRVDYGFDETAAKIYDIPDLDNFLGDRLRDGR